MKSIYADFMKMDYEGRLVLTCLGTHKDLEKHNISLKDGLKLVFYNDDEDDNGNPDNLVVEGIVQYDENNERWVANINWDGIKNISKLSVEEKQKLGIV
jgi:hypothetical protein